MARSQLFTEEQKTAAWSRTADIMKAYSDEMVKRWNSETDTLRHPILRQENRFTLAPWWHCRHCPSAAQCPQCLSAASVLSSYGGAIEVDIPNKLLIISHMYSSPLPKSIYCIG